MTNEDDVHLEELMGRFGLTPPGSKAVFVRLRDAMAGHGVLASKNKELVALAVCITGHREDSIADHVRQAICGGASRDEILEVIGLAILMGGQSSLPYGNQAALVAQELQ